MNAFSGVAKLKDIYSLKWKIVKTFSTQTYFNIFNVIALSSPSPASISITFLNLSKIENIYLVFKKCF